MTAGPGPLPGPLGIVAGGGLLPGRVGLAARAAGRDVFVVALEGYAEPEVIGGFPHEVVRLGAVGASIAALRRAGCEDIVLAGPVKRPSLLDLRPDAVGAKLLARVGRAAFSGDDGFLAAIVRVLGEEGFHVLGAHEVLHEALAPPGLLTGAKPDAEALADIARGVAVVRALGAADVGQACVVQQGIVLAVEAVEGTDAMLARSGALARPGPGGVLVKLVKPGQDRRADLPTLGPKTIPLMRNSGLRGVAFEAGGTILLERAAMIEAAEAAGLFLLGIEPGAPDWKTGDWDERRI
ncbi:MAG TPA: UDP-2,3-diacylglucosamine diphosphatase LpxI [Acidiphilium sp.]